MHSHTLENTREAKKVTIIGAILDTLLGFAKIIVGFMFHSHALIADGIHSLSDLATDVMVVVIIGISHADPDEEHPYGHARYETLGTVVLGCLLIAVAGAMAYESIINLFNETESFIPGWPTLIIAALSIVSKEWIFRYSLAVGKRLRSDLLIANAWHSRTDAISSIVVFVGIGGAMLGAPWLDSLAAVAVAAFVAKIGWDLSWKSVQELVDTAIEPERLKAITDTTLAVEGVASVHSFKSRQMGTQTLLEMHLQVAPHLSSSEGHYIGDAAVSRLITEFDDIGHVIFHIDTEEDDDDAFCSLLPPRSIILAEIESRLTSISSEISIKALTLHYFDNGVEVELFLAAEAAQPLQSIGLNSAQLADQLSRELQTHPWFRHLDLWLKAGHDDS